MSAPWWWTIATVTMAMLWVLLINAEVKIDRSRYLHWYQDWENISCRAFFYVMGLGPLVYLVLMVWDPRP